MSSSSPIPSPSAPLSKPPDASTSGSLTSPRRLKQLGLAVGGLVFLGASMVITRRSIARKTLAAARIYNNVPATPSSSIAAKTQTLSASSRQSSTPMASQALTQDNPKDAPADPDGSGSLVAFEALGLATMNVVAFALLLTGSIAYAFDLSSVDDLRAYARRRFGLTGGAPADVASAEQALEEWIAETLERRRRREGASEAKKDEK